MSEQIKRYDMRWNHDLMEDEMIEDAAGDYVTFHSHDMALAAKEARISKMQSAISIIGFDAGASKGLLSRWISDRGQEFSGKQELLVILGALSSIESNLIYAQSAHAAQPSPEPIAASQGEEGREVPVAYMLADAVGGSALEFQEHELLQLQNRYGGEIVPLYAQPARQVGGGELLERAARNLEIFDKRPRSMCRDCADCNGICQNTGLDCDIGGLVKELRAALAPAAVAVVVPAQCTDRNQHVKYRGGWNSCLSAIARLNRRAIPAGLLERCLKQMEDDWYQIDGEWGPDPDGLDGSIAKGYCTEIAELRVLLGNGDEK